MECSIIVMKFDNLMTQAISKIRIFNEHPDINERTQKFLGVYLDEYLSFDIHCNKICNKLAKSNFIISRVKNILPPKSLKTLYFALVHPYLLCCLPIFSSTTQKNLKRISKMQNSCQTFHQVKIQYPISPSVFPTKNTPVRSPYHTNQWPPHSLHLPQILP